jgi:hypothetical protein
LQMKRPILVRMRTGAFVYDMDKDIFQRLP